MNSKSFLAGLAAAAIVFAGVGFYLVDKASQTGGSSAPNYAVAGDQNYAVAIASITQGKFTLGPLTATTSSVTSSVPLQRGLTYGLHLGNTCGVQLASASSTGGFSADAQLTAIATSSATATVTFFNGANANVTVATGTLTVVCQNY